MPANDHEKTIRHTSRVRRGDHDSLHTEVRGERLSEAAGHRQRSLADSNRVNPFERSKIELGPSDVDPRTNPVQLPPHYRRDIDRRKRFAKNLQGGLFEVGQGNALIELLRFPKHGDACACHFYVLIFGPGAHADRANAFAIYFQGNPAANRCLMTPASNGQAQ
jgi:hypothetical protein